ncbi:glycoside hydrolase family 79 protein [Phlyctema vagabunda]|uniref:Glycoside hydrolase family 79 protein n=1 Tax=Phlyctema vagabunda TaxID=108571 RepID=A0ABR4PYL9_9HELO
MQAFTQLYFLFLVPLISAASISFSVDSNLPQDASKVVKKDFASFGIQASSFPYYAGNRSTGPNAYSNNLLTQLTQRTGVEPVLRVGGTNGDSANYDPAQAQPVTSPEGDVLANRGVPHNLTLGPSYFEGFGELQARWVYSAPFDTFNNTNTITQTQAFFANVQNKSDRVLALELGNEPDLYLGRPIGNGMWPDVTPRTFAARWLDYVADIVSRVSLPAGPIWQGLTLARAQGHNELTLRPIFDGINKNNYLKSVSVHYYQDTCSTGAASQSHLLNHSFITAGFGGITNNIEWLNVSDPDVALEYVLGETGRYEIDNCNQTSSDVGNFAGALWTLDMMLYAMTVNVTRVNMQLGVNMGYAAWHPVRSARYRPNTQPIYYAHVFVADAIGTAEQTRLAHLTPNTTGSPHYQDLAPGYAIYHSGKLTRVALLNLRRYNAPDPRPEKAYTLRLPASAKSVTLRRLESPGGAEAHNNVSFAGLQFKYVDAGLSSGTREVESKDVVNREVDIVVPDTSAALVDVHE